MASTVRGSGGRTRVLPWLAAAPGPLTPRLLRWLCGALTRVPVSALLGAVALAWLGVSLAGGTAGPVRVRLAAEVSALAGSPAPSALGGSDGGDGSCADSGTCGGSSWGGSFTNPRDTDMGNSSFSNVTEPVDDQNGSAASVGRYDDSSGGQSATRNRMNPADMGGSGANASGGRLTDLIGQLSALVRKLGDVVSGAAQQSGQAGEPTATDAAQGPDGSGSATAGNTAGKAAQAAADPGGQSPRTASGGAPRPTEDSAGPATGSGSAGTRTAMLRPEDQQPGSGWTGAGKTGPDSGGHEIQGPIPGRKTPR